jgi:transposase
MRVLHGRCAGLDVHKDMVMACVRVRGRGNRVTYEVREFSTTTAGLLALAEWLSEREVTHVAMEATGVYWKPVWHVLEESFTLVLANAQHIKNVPGRKSDVNDATWISDLLAHGLIRDSFVPPRPVQELRGLTRTRKQLSRQGAKHALRIQKTLEDANLKLSSVLSDTVGQSGRRILRALIEGETEPSRLAALASAQCKASREEIAAALTGKVTDHHRFLLRLHLGQIEAAEQAIEETDRRIEEVLDPFREAEELLLTVPGVKTTSARAILAEIGTDMSRFPTAAHLVSWACLCPRSDKSAGKHRSTRLRKASPWIKPIMVQVGWSAAHTNGTYANAQFRRIASRRGTKKAVVAVAASILTAIFHILKNHVPYHDLGPEYFDRRDTRRVANRLVHRLEELGFKVELQAA